MYMYMYEHNFYVKFCSFFISHLHVLYIVGWGCGQGEWSRGDRIERGSGRAENETGRGRTATGTTESQ